MPTHFSYASRAIQGARNYQEDACVFVTLPGLDQPGAWPPTLSPHALLAVLADGMGGHVGGAIASNTACNSYVSSFCQLPGVLSARLRNALLASNRAIAEKVKRDPAMNGMGCTLIGAAFGASGLNWVSVGDSLLLLFRRDTLQQLNEDHSLAPMIDELAKQGSITKAEARDHPRRHLLTSVLTGHEIEIIDLRMEAFSLFPGDCVIVASDGLQSLELGEIAQIMQKTHRNTPDTIAEALIRAVEKAEHPFQDNTTIMVVQPHVTPMGL